VAEKSVPHSWGGYQGKPGNNKGGSERDGGGLGHIGGQWPHWSPAFASGKARTGEPGCCMGTKGSAGNPSMAPAEHTNYDYMAPPPEMPRRPRTGEAGDELATLMQGLMGAQANDSGWPTFSGKYVEYPRFCKEW
jgi:hypothetical protein